MIITKNNVKILNFGFGDIYTMTLTEKKSRSIIFYNGEEGKVGRLCPKYTKKQAWNVFRKKSEVIMIFNNIESLDVTINNLIELRKGMKKHEIEKKQ